MKTAPPTGSESRSCEGLAVVWTRKVECFFAGAHQKSVRKRDWILVKTFFFEDHLILAGKTVWILVKTFFLGGGGILTENTPQSDSRLMKIWVEFVYCCFKLPKLFQAPSLCEFLATRLSSEYTGRRGGGQICQKHSLSHKSVKNLKNRQRWEIKFDRLLKHDEYRFHKKNISSRIEGGGEVIQY